MAVTVYGASDDLIEVEGDISEEFGAHHDSNYVAFSNGVVLRVAYDRDGFWRIAPVAGGSRVTIEFADDEETNYSDRATITEDVAWAVHGIEFAKARARA